MSFSKFFRDFIDSRRLEGEIEKAMGEFHGRYDAIDEAIERARQFNLSRKPGVINYIPLTKYLRREDCLSYEQGEF